MTSTDVMPESETETAPEFVLASRLGALSFATGLLICCPATSFLAVCSGVMGLILGRHDHGAKWKRYALAGVVLGLVGGAGTLAVGFSVRAHWEREGRVLYSGPNNALLALSKDELQVARAEFAGGLASLSDEELAAFAEQLEMTWGNFIAAHSNADEPPELTGSGPWTETYGATFEHLSKDTQEPERVTILVSAQLLRVPPSDPRGRLQLGFILLDPDGVRLDLPVQKAATKGNLESSNDG